MFIAMCLSHSSMKHEQLDITKYIKCSVSEPLEGTVDEGPWTTTSCAFSLLAIHETILESCNMYICVGNDLRIW